MGLFVEGSLSSVELRLRASMRRSIAVKSC